jgi:gas vesicle protein
LREKFEKPEDVMSRGNKWTESFSTFAVGVGVGAALGILFAPRSGQDTRDVLKEGANDLVDTVNEGLGRAQSTARDWARRTQDGIEEAKDQLRQAADAGERAYQDARNGS